MTTARQLLVRISEQLAMASADDSQALLKTMLCKQYPDVVMAIFFANSIDEEDRHPLIVKLKNRFKTERNPGRAALTWVYGDSPLNALVKHYNPPSRTKSMLVWKVLEKTHPVLPWLNNRTLHTMAFQPGYFNRRTFKPSHEKVDSWGPLYHRVPIDRSAARPRILEIPNWPLKIVQRTLLNLLSPTLTECLDSCVYGVGKEKTIFEHARVHLDQQYIVSFDLTSFFPSVKLAHVIRGLKKLPDPMFFIDRHFNKSQDNSDIPRIGLPPSPKSIKEKLPWHDDAIILIARLCTCRGHLPQGAPTSPLLANIAFREFDLKIKKRLGKDFIYTRYFDDLTISISKPSAACQKIRSPHDLEKRVQEDVEMVLASSRFILNHRKTRSSRISEGHLITGLRVSQEKIDLPRKSKRHIRSLIHALESDGLIQSAERRIGNEIIYHTVFRKSRSSSLHEHFYHVQRTSFERQAVLMLRHVAPGLVIEYNLPEHTARLHKKDTIRFENDRDGKWDLIQRSLNYYWQRKIETIKVDECIELHSKDGLVLKVKGNHWIEFFLLPKEQAIKVVKFWHQTMGLAMFLKSAPKIEYERIHDFGDRLYCTLRDARFGPIRKEEYDRGALKSSDDLEFTEEDEIYKQILTFVDSVETYSKLIDREKLLSVDVQITDRIAKPVASEKEFYEFLRIINDETLQNLSRYPSSSYDGSNVFQVIHEGAGLALGARIGRYVMVENFKKETRHNFKSEEPRILQKSVLKRAGGIVLKAVNESAGLDKVISGKYNPIL